MKTLKYMPLLLLLLFAGSFSGLAQTDTLKPSLTDEEVIRLRAELVDALDSNNFVLVCSIRDSLWFNQPTQGQYLSYQEYYLTIFLTGEFDEILLWQARDSLHRGVSTGYPEIINEIKKEVRQQSLFIYSEINKKHKLNDQLTLKEVLLELLGSNNEDDKKSKGQDRLIINQTYYTQREFEATPSPFNNKRTSEYNNTSLGITKVCFGTFYKTGFFSGDIGTVFSDFQSIKPLYIGFFCDILYWDFGLSLFGTFGKMNSYKFLDQPVEGEYYGKYRELFVSLGIEVIDTKYLSVVPTISYTGMVYWVYPTKLGMFQTDGELTNQYDYTFPDNTIDCLGPGVFLDLRIIQFKNRPDYSISLRFRYNAFIVLSEGSFHLHGLAHEFSFGILLNIDNIII